MYLASPHLSFLTPISPGFLLHIQNRTEAARNIEIMTTAVLRNAAKQHPNAASGSGEQQMQHQPSPQDQQRPRMQTVIITVILLIVFLLSWLGSETQHLQKPEEVQLRTEERKKHNMMKCLLLCENLQEQIQKGRRQSTLLPFQGKDPLDRKALLQLVSDAKSRLLEKLHDDYGPIYFQKMFVDGDTYRPFAPITPDGESLHRLKRKLLIKILSVQSKVLSQQQNKESCDCNGVEVLVSTNDHGAKTSQTSSNQTTAPSNPTFETYVWATGGHSAAAGHGNLFNETYTAFMERDLKDVFGSIGIDFEGRNYAMGGTSSAGEIAMCWEQIFGDDVDFFSWDYGMTDGNFPARLLQYGYRGGLSPGRPAILGVHVGGRVRKHREGRLRDLEQLGMAVFYGADESWSAMQDAIPDSKGISTEKIEQLPEYIRNFKCGGALEKGDPYCGNEKFTKYICKKRSRQTSWHPGIKDHAMTGHGMALMLMDALVNAVKDLSEHETKNVDELLSQLQKEEDDLFADFTKADLPSDYKNLYKVGNDIHSDFDLSLFFKGRSFCHTARTPSRTRYLGYLTNTDKVGGIAPFGKETYDVGIKLDDATKAATSDGLMRLVWTEHKEREDCPVPCKPDYKDFFLTTQNDGWTKLTIPNEAEKKAYRYDPSEFKGVVVLFLRGCDFGKCEQGFLKVEDFADKKWELKVNGKEVVSMHDIGYDALITKGEDGAFFPPNSNGDYDIEIKVNEAGSFVKVSAFVLY